MRIDVKGWCSYVLSYYYSNLTLLRIVGRWQRWAERYQQFVEAHRDGKLVLLELGVGFNTPSIIRFPFEEMAAQYPHTALVRFNQQSMTVVSGIKNMIAFSDCADVFRAVRTQQKTIKEALAKQEQA